MAEPRIAPYGAWQSPVSTEMLTSGALRFVEIDVDGDDIYWVESRPDEQGRYAVMRRSADGETTEVTGPEHSARTLVHEYGGGALAVQDRSDLLLELQRPAALATAGRRSGHGLAGHARHADHSGDRRALCRRDDRCGARALDLRR